MFCLGATGWLRNTADAEDAISNTHVRRSGALPGEGRWRRIPRCVRRGAPQQTGLSARWGRLEQSTSPPATPGSHRDWGGGCAGCPAPSRVPRSDLSAGKSTSLQAKGLDSLAVKSNARTMQCRKPWPGQRTDMQDLLQDAEPAIPERGAGPASSDKRKPSAETSKRNLLILRSFSLRPDFPFLIRKSFLFRRADEWQKLGRLWNCVDGVKDVPNGFWPPQTLTSQN